MNATRNYVARRLAEGRTTAEIMRSLKRYVARELYPHLAATDQIWSDGPGPRMPRRHRLSCERTAGPSLPNTFGTAWPHKSLPSPEWPLTGLPAPPKQPLTNVGASIRRDLASADLQIWRAASRRRCYAIDRTRTKYRPPNSGSPLTSASKTSMSKCRL
jgi:hypothetical protein